MNSSGKRLTGMGFFNFLLNYGKSRMIGSILRRTIGGPMGTGLLAAYLGKKAYNYYRSRRRLA